MASVMNTKMVKLSMISQGLFFTISDKSSFIDDFCSNVGTTRSLVERKVINNKYEDDWTLVGSKKGNGTTSETHQYTFYDDVSDLNATSLEYRLKQIDYNGNYSYSEIVEVNNFTPNIFVLEQNYPNPFNPSTLIKYSIADKQFVTLKVYDVLGNEISTLVSETKPAGNYEVEFNANNISAGVYYYTIITDNFVETKKMILLK